MHSAVGATRALLRAALKEPTNARFQLLSAATLPLWPPAVVYQRLMAEPRSHLDACHVPVSLQFMIGFQKWLSYISWTSREAAHAGRHVLRQGAANLQTATATAVLGDLAGQTGVTLWCADDGGGAVVGARRRGAAGGGAAAAVVAVLDADTAPRGAGRQRVARGAALRRRLHRRPGAQLQVASETKLCMAVLMLEDRERATPTSMMIKDPF